MFLTRETTRKLNKFWSSSTKKINPWTKSCGSTQIIMIRSQTLKLWVAQLPNLKWLCQTICREKICQTNKVNSLYLGSTTNLKARTHWKIKKIEIIFHQESWLLKRRVQSKESPPKLQVKKQSIWLQKPAKEPPSSTNRKSTRAS